MADNNNDSVQAHTDELYGGTSVKTAPIQPPTHLVNRILASRSKLVGERKQVTVLVCDIVGSVSLTQQLGLDLWAPILTRYLHIISEAVHRHEGTVDRYLGDGLRALFGAPLAHENHAVRACLAACEIQEALAKLAAELEQKHAVSLRTRMGMHSGDIVFGKIDDNLNMEYSAVGQCIDLGMHIEQAAEPDSCYLSADTAALVYGYIDYELAGSLSLKGNGEQVAIYRLARARPNLSRLDISRQRGLSSFVGRKVETALLQQSLQRALDGHGQNVAIVGPAGMGKSRLCWEFKQECRARNIPVHSAYGTPHSGKRAYSAILPLYRSVYGINEDNLDTATARERVSARLLSLSDRAEAALPELFNFLGIADPANPKPAIQPELQRRLYLNFTRWSFNLLSREQTMVFFLDDLHWFDEASLGMVQVMLESIKETRTLIVTNFRPELETFRPGDGNNLQYISLQPLDANAVQELLSKLLGNDSSLAELPQRLVETSGGNPFFVEEIVRSLIDNQQIIKVDEQFVLQKPIEKLPLPASLQSLLAARIDRLPKIDKNILQAAAVIGRSFTLKHLVEMGDWNMPELQDAMQRLQRAEFLYEDSDHIGGQWHLKHALTQEVAYETLLKGTRRNLHFALAETIQAACGKNPEDQAMTLAYHWEAAGEMAKAAKAAHKAARWTHKIDLREALHYRQEVLRLIEGLPETPELLHMGIAARRELIQWVMITGIDPETAETYFTEGCAIAEKTGDFITLGTLIGAFSLLECQRARFTEAMALADKCTGMLKNIKHAEIQATMDGVIFGTAYGSAGRVIAAKEATERALVLTEENPNLGAINAFNIRMWSGALHGMTQGASGQPAEAISKLERLAPQAFQDKETSAALIIGFKAWLRLYTGDTHDAFDRCEKALRFANQIEIGYWQGAAHTYYGLALITHGRWAEARTHLETVQQLNQHNYFMEYYNTLASVHLPLALLKTGKADKAQRLTQRARDLAEASNSYFFINDNCWVTSQVLRQASGTSAITKLEDNLQRWQDCLDASGMELCRHLWWWEKARLHQLQGNSAACEEALQQALTTAQACQASGHAEAIRKELTGTEA